MDNAECDPVATAAIGLDPRTGDPFGCTFGPSSVLRDLEHQGIGMQSRSVTKGTFVTPRYTLEWTPNDDTLVFFSASKGVKPGGTSSNTGGTWADADGDGDTDELEFETETLWSYELGAKKTWLGGKLRTNVAGFWQSYSNRQVSTQIETPSGNSTSKIENAGKARILGAEFDGTWQPDDHWTLSASYTFLDTEYKEFSIISRSAGTITEVGLGQAGAEASCGSRASFVRGAGLRWFCEVDMSGNRLEGIPKHSAIAGVEFATPFFNSTWEWIWEADVRYQGKRWLDEANSKYFQDYAVLDLRMGIASEQIEILFYADNVFDDDTIRTADDMSNSVDQERVFPLSTSPADNVLASLANPFTFGVRASFNF